VTAPSEQLAPAGSISGKVLGGGAATPQTGVCVVAVPVSPADVMQPATTDEHGNYEVTGLAPGKYQVYFGDPFCVFSGSGYAPQWYNNQPAQATAAQVSVTAGGTATGINATLSSDGAISGVVTQHPNTPIAGECATAIPVSPVPDPLFGDTLHDVIAVTGTDGSYTLVGLLPGRYKVEFSTGCGDTGFRTQWWDNAGSQATATVITVSASATVPGIDATLNH
jgi:Carboxypeptidase regulatory-like domain